MQKERKIRGLFLTGIIAMLFTFCPVAIAADKVAVIPLWSDRCDEIQTVTSNGQVWMDRNLGAVRVAQSVYDYQAYGWLYQWGRLADGHELPSSPTIATLSSDDVPGHGRFITMNASPNDWRNTKNDGLWDPGTGINNPCPAGFRVPTATEWATERASWSSDDAAGAFGSPLKLVAAGFRRHTSGEVVLQGAVGNYWSSTVDGNNASRLSFEAFATISDEPRAYGNSVRCIKD